MIQRIQSLFLIGFAVCMILTVFAPLWTKSTSDGQEQITFTAWEITYMVDGEIKREEPVYYFGAGAIVSAFIALFSLFSYRNRLRQMKLGALNALLIAGFMVGMVLWIMEAEEWLNPMVRGEFGWGFYLPIAALVFNMAANRFIRKDEKLVRSVDRLR